MDDTAGPNLDPIAKVKANYLNQVNKVIAASNWASDVVKGLETATQVLNQDLDIDGEDEYILKNNKIFAIFENDGGKLEYAFAYDLTNGPMQLIAPAQQTVLPSTSGIFEDGEIGLMTKKEYPGNIGYWQLAAFIEDNYTDKIFTASIGKDGLTFSSSDNQIVKTFTLEGDTITAQYSTVNSVQICFGLPINMANMYSVNWAEKISKIETKERLGWKINDGGYAFVNLLDTTCSDLASFTDSPANKEMKDRKDESTYPWPGHWLPFPLNTVKVSGVGNFKVSLTLSSGVYSE